MNMSIVVFLSSCKHSHKLHSIDTYVGRCVPSLTPTWHQQIWSLLKCFFVKKFKQVNPKSKLAHNMITTYIDSHLLSLNSSSVLHRIRISNSYFWHTSAGRSTSVILWLPLRVAEQFWAAPSLWLLNSSQVQSAKSATPNYLPSKFD